VSAQSVTSSVALRARRWSRQGQQLAGDFRHCATGARAPARAEGRDAMTREHREHKYEIRKLGEERY